MSNIKEWFYYKNSDKFIKTIGIDHLIGLFIVLAMMFFLYLLHKKNTLDSNIEKKFSILIGTIGITSLLFLKVYEQSIAPWYYSIPLHFCSIALIFGIISMFTYNNFISKNMVFLGITGGFFGILFPGISQPFPYYRFLEYFISHGLLIFISVYLVLIRNIRVSLIDVKNYSILIFVLSILVVIINSCFETKFMFLNSGLPSNVSHIFPKWPFYYPLLLIFAGTCSLVIYYTTNLLTKGGTTND